MSKKEKLIARLKSKPKDFMFDEAKTLLKQCGYKQAKTGKTGGSRVKFIIRNRAFQMHKPHPNNTLLDYQIIELINELKEEGLIWTIWWNTKIIMGV